MRHFTSTVAGFGLMVLVQSSGAQATAAAVPFGVGEELTYKATFGRIPAGTARMRVDCIEIVRGRQAYHLVFTIDGGIPFFRVHDRYESWVDVETLSSLRHRQIVSEGHYRRTTTYEIYPERAAYRKNGDTLMASVSNPLDDGSFIYAVRAAAVKVGETREEARYFRPDRNPVVFAGLRRESVSVPAGIYSAVVVAPTIRTKGMFAEGGEAQVWFSDDDRRVPVQLKTKFGGFSIKLELQSLTSGDGPAPTLATVP